MESVSVCTVPDFRGPDELLDPHLLAAFLERVRQHMAVPGISLTVCLGDSTVTVCVGRASLLTGHPLSPSSHFRLGCVVQLLANIRLHELVSTPRLRAVSGWNLWISRLDRRSMLRRVL